LKSLPEKEELDMDRVRLPKDADTDRVKNGWDVVAVPDDGDDAFVAVACLLPSREEEEPCRLRTEEGGGSNMDLVRLTEEVAVRVRFPPRPLHSVRSELVRCIWKKI
jgi:hypothetical protein